MSSMRRRRPRRRRCFRPSMIGRGAHFGNARAVRKIFDEVLARQAERLATIADLDEAALTALTADDIPDPPERAQ